MTKPAKRKRTRAHDKHSLEPIPFGYLMTVDLYRCRAGACDDLGLCYNFLEALCERLHMTMQAPPFIFRSPKQYRSKAGLSGWVPLIESGIQIHTLSPKNFISIDVYCCHDIDAWKVVALANDTFEPKGWELGRIPRGLLYHEHEGSV
jgi:S-adenosylmethionine/arginine decarboxylase-like enzyme